MKSWLETTLKKVAKKVDYGYTASATTQNTGVRFLRITDIVPSSIEWDTVPFCEISESDLQKCRLSQDDIVIARTGATVGYAKQIVHNPPQSVFASYLVRVKLKDDVSKKFVGLLVESNNYKNYINTIAGGSAQPNANAKDLSSYPFYLPPNPIQKKLAAILSAYDDLIENNQRRIALLEKMAEEIYREWFVRMRFPGHEQAKFKKGVPEGWRVGKISDAASFKYGFTESALENPEWPKFLRVTDMNKRSFINWDDVPNCPIDDVQFEKYRLSEGDIVIARMADPGKVAIVEEDIRAVFASYLIKIEYNQEKLTPYFFFYTLGSAYYLGLFSGADSGSTRGSINASAIGSTAFIYPDFDLMRLFDEEVSALREEMVCLSKLNDNLVKTRDGMLPRLISGKLDVEKLDIHFPPSMLSEAEVQEPQAAHA
jgi:type I restriction enzyme, S subunit